MVQQSILLSVTDKGECHKKFYPDTQNMNGRFPPLRRCTLKNKNKFKNKNKNKKINKKNFFETSCTNSIYGDAYPGS